MPTVDESLETQDSILAAALSAGFNTISINQQLTFTKYVRLVLPVDGFVFWVRADVLGPSALYNTTPFNAAQVNQPQEIKTPANQFQAACSIHYVTDRRQEEEETYSVNTVLITTSTELVDLNNTDPNVLYLATIDDISFAFSTRTRWFAQSGLFQYRGNAVYADMATQIVNEPAFFDSRNVVVSNSLPLWLALNGYVAFPAGFSNPILPLYPSFALPANIEPPFASVHVAPESTRALQMAPNYGRRSSHYQLCAETVKITMYGMRNFDAMDFVDCVLQYSADTDNFGIMNMPVLRDEKRTQVELATLAMKKSVVFEISYHQKRVNDVARQLILRAIPTYFVGDQQVA